MPKAPTKKKAGAKKTAKRTGAKPPKKPVLLTGGNPQIAKADGDAAVQAYVAAMPGWKRDIGRSLDALIERTIPGVRKAVRWNSPFYGTKSKGWFLGVHCTAKYIKVAFFNGASLAPSLRSRPRRRVRGTFTSTKTSPSTRRSSPPGSGRHRSCPAGPGSVVRPPAAPQKSDGHEAAHLYFVQGYPAARPPSWLAEGMATYFEGFEVDAQARLTFHHRPKTRASGFAQAWADGRALKLDELLTSNAGVLLNTSADKALVFYAQCWALFYFLQHADPASKARFDEFLVAVGRGSTPSLAKALGLEPQALESAFLAYTRSK